MIEQDTKARILITDILPDAKVMSINYPLIVVSSTGTPKQIFDAQRTLRTKTGKQWELMMGRMEDKNKLRVQLLAFRGVGVEK